MNIYESYRKVKKGNKTCAYIFYFVGVCFLWVILYDTGGFNKGTSLTIISAISAILVIMGIATLIRPTPEERIKKKLNKLLKPEDVQLFNETFYEELQNDLYYEHMDDTCHSLLLITKTWFICISNHNETIRRRDTIVKCKTGFRSKGCDDIIEITFSDEEYFTCEFGRNKKVEKTINEYIELRN